MIEESEIRFRVKSPDWKKEYHEICEKYCFAQKLLEEYRSYALGLFSELSSIGEKLHDLETILETVLQEDPDIGPFNTNTEDTLKYIALLEDENRELKEQLRAAVRSEG